MYLFELEKVREMRNQELRREMEVQRLLSHLPRNRRSMSRRLAGKLGLLLLKLGAWLKEFEQAPEDRV